MCSIKKGVLCEFYQEQLSYRTPLGDCLYLMFFSGFLNWHVLLNKLSRVVKTSI